MKYITSFVLANFPLVMLLFSILIAFAKSGNFFNRLCGAMLIFAVGFSGIWGFIVLGFYPEIASADIGWTSNQFEFEVAIAYLAMGVLGITAYFSSCGYKKATAVFVTVFLVGIAIEHLHEIIVMHNLKHGNFGSIIWTDLLIPAVLWISVLLSKEKQPHQINWANH